MDKEKDLRVWVIVNPPSDPKYYPIDTPKDAKTLIDAIADEQLKNDDIDCNAFGLEVYEDGEWCEWYGEDGEDITGQP